MIDNPPFSILSQIVRWYMERDIKFFLFAPTLTLFSVASGEANYIYANASIIYDNGARVNTSFVTNLGDAKVLITPEIKRIIRQILEPDKKPKIKYEYPNNVLCVKTCTYHVNRGHEIEIKNAHFVRELESMKKKKKTLYGSGFIVGNKIADELLDRKISEDVDEVWALSDKEKEIIRKLDELDEDR